MCLVMVTFSIIMLFQGTVSYYLLLDNYYRANNYYSVELDTVGVCIRFPISL